MTKLKKDIQKVLNKFPEVKWDRYIDSKKDLTFYGWITREDDKFDYLELGFKMNGKLEWYSTSSSKYSKDFGKRLNFEHFDCKRVEDLFSKGEVETIKLFNN